MSDDTQEPTACKNLLKQLYPEGYFEDSQYLADRWAETLRRGHIVFESSDMILGIIIREYDRPCRYYHNVSHLISCFKILEERIAPFPEMGVL